MVEKIQEIPTREESLLRQRAGSPEALDELAASVSSAELKLLVATAISLSWNLKNSNLTSFARKYGDKS